MRIGNKLFPYPTLNREQEISGYNKTSSFELNFQTTEEGELIKDKEHVLLKNIHFNLKNTQLQKLYTDKKLKCALIVECSSSLFRKNFSIENIPKDIYIPLDKLNNLVDISAYMYVAEKIDGYLNDDFNEDYLDYQFDLVKYDIVAIDDGYKFRIDIEPDDDNKVTSIFTLVRSDTNDEKVYYESGANKIKIYLSPTYYNEYSSLKNTAYANNIVFGILLVPVLSRCLDEIKTRFEDSDDIEEIIEQKMWFKSICISYETVMGSRLTIDEYKDKDSLDLAQMLLNNATCKGLHDFNDILFKGPEGDEDDE